MYYLNTKMLLFHVITFVDFLLGDLGVSKQTFPFTIVSTHLVARGWAGLLGGVVGFSEEPVDKASYGSSHHGGYNRHPPPCSDGYCNVNIYRDKQ